MQTGTILNQRYEIVGLIAEGGMARVFRARDRALDRTVALKVLREQYAVDEAFLARFQQEARAAAALAHPNIVNVYDVGVEDGVNYIVMELVEGQNLKQIIQQDGPLSPPRALELAQQILAALGFAHQRGIVHRDVKPQNILVTADGQVKVTDFGIARASAASQLTETGLVMGSVHYCAPEQAMGKGSSQASDVYSVGIVLFEMLSGQLPFEADNALGVALRHVQDTPPSLRHLNPRLSPALESIVNKALVKEPAARYASAEEMLLTIQEYRRLGEQSTAPFAVVSPNAATASAQANGASSARTAPVKKKRHAVDWLVVIFAILILGMVAGWIPLAARLYDLYFQHGTAPADSPTALATVPGPLVAAPRVSATAGTKPTAAPSPSPSPLSGEEQRAQVPLLMGKTFTEARRQVESLGLHLAMFEAYDDLVPVGRIVSQTVPAGESVHLGEKIDVTVSVGVRVGATMVTVPNIVDRSLDEARNELQRAGLRVDYRTQWNDRVPAGRVVSQLPLGYASVVTGTLVSLLVSDGPTAARTPLPTRAPTPTSGTSPPVVRGVVPALVGLPEQDARRIIDLAGFSNSYTNYQGADQVNPANRDFFLGIPVGSVVSQDPSPGVRYPEGGVIRIAVRLN